MNSKHAPPPSRTLRAILLGGALLAAILGGAYITWALLPASKVPTRRQARPMVQIVRQQPGLPDLADLIDSLCPSVAIIVPHGLEAGTDLEAITPVPASEYSADGWLVTWAAKLPPLPLDAIFGDGRRAELSDVRVDQVSGLAVIKASAPGAPLPFSDRAFPRVGQFGFTLSTPAGSGCSAASSMIGSDFLSDGIGATVGYFRLRPVPDAWSAGTPLLGADGQVLGVAADNPAGAVVPASIASVIVDELIRNSLSPSTSFGFRAIDYAAPLVARLGDLRSGAGVAYVSPRSSAGDAGLQAGDIVTAVNNVPVSSASELSRALDARSDKPELTVQRRSRELKVQLSLK